MQAPTQIEPTGLADYLDVMTRAAFQSGMSWRVVEAKWDGFRKAFAGFDPAVVAAFTDDDVERLVTDAGIIRNRRKIEATISTAITDLPTRPACKKRLSGESEKSSIRAPFLGVGAPCPAHLTSTEQ